MAILAFRKLADKTSGRRITRYHPETGAKMLVNPDTPGEEHEPWPLLGVRIVDVNGSDTDPPQRTAIDVGRVEAGMAEGWIERVGARPVVRPAGAQQDIWTSGTTGTPHTFIHADYIIFKTVDGDVRYRVVHQPDKYAADGDDETPVSPELYAAGETRVDWFYGLELVEEQG